MSLLAEQRLLGIPVLYKPDLRVISDTFGFWKWKVIRVGPGFITGLRAREKQAVLMHEAGHVKLFHLERRILNLWRAFWFPSLVAYCREQEFEADRFAAAAGYGLDLAIFFRKIERCGQHKYSFHPDVNDRVARLLGG